MAEQSTRLPILLLLVFITLPTVLSIRCWVCRSDSDETCADPFNNYTSPIIDCDHIRLPYGQAGGGFQSDSCRYTRYKTAEAREDPEGMWIVVRDCAYLDEPCDGVGDKYRCETIQRADGAIMEYTTCTDFDGCNHGTASTAAIIMSLLPITVTFLIYQCTSL